MASTKLVLGRFVRLTQYNDEVLPGPAWGEIVWVSSARDDCDVQMFCGVELLSMLHYPPRGAGGSWNKPIPIGGLMGADGVDKYTVHTINQLPHYALTALTKYKLLREGD